MDTKKPKKQYKKKERGRPPVFPTPDDFERKFQEYKEWCRVNPYLIEDFGGNPPEKITLKKQRPLTIDGFFLFCGIDAGYVFMSKAHKGKVYNEEEFSKVISRVRREIINEQISGGLVGVYHHNLVARLNGISEKVDNAISMQRKTVDELFPPTSEIIGEDEPDGEANK